jgi:hypothetical protein
VLDTTAFFSGGRHAPQMDSSRAWQLIPDANQRRYSHEIWRRRPNVDPNQRRAVIVSVSARLIFRSGHETTCFVVSMVSATPDRHSLLRTSYLLAKIASDVSLICSLRSYSDGLVR